MAQRELEIKVEGMSCDACVRAIERKLTRVAGVASARVNLHNGSAIVQYDDSRARADQLIGAVEQIGYHASRV